MVQMTYRRVRLKGSFFPKKVRFSTPLAHALTAKLISSSHFSFHEGDITP